MELPLPPKPEAPLDHEAIKQYFADRDKDWYASHSRMEAELKEMYVLNPCNRFVFGRAQWTYVPMAFAEKIAEIIARHRPPEIVLPQLIRTHTYVHYQSRLGQKLWYIPPRTDHRMFLEWFEAEWPYATEEQREVGREMLKFMEHDGVGIRVSLLALAQGVAHVEATYS
ncbi:hypothetical protein [Burkholderia phage FLC9]|nr:hypothetical protein [Burkholderia phage FLC9]